MFKGDVMRVKFLRGFENYKESMEKIGELAKLPENILIEGVELKKYVINTSLPQHTKHLITKSTESVNSCEYVGKLPIQGMVVIGVKCTVINDGFGKMWFIEISNEKHLNMILAGEFDGN